MRRNIRRNACGFCIGFQNFPESLTTHRTSGAVDKQYIIIPSMHQGCARTPQILLQRLFRRSAERNDPLLFIAAGDVAHHKVDILYLQMDQLTDADTGRIQHFQHCFVADTLWRVGFGLAADRPLRWKGSPAFSAQPSVAATLSTGQIPFFPPDMHIGKTYESPQCCARSLPGRSVPAPDIINKNLKPLHSSALVFLFRAPSKKLPAFEDRADRRLLYFLTLSFPSVDSP